MHPIDQSLMAERLSPALRKIIWAYIFLYFNINLGTVDILPSWAGYLFILSALPVLEGCEPSAGLLRNVAIILAAWNGFDWVLTIFEANSYGSGILYSMYALAASVIGVIGIYFHFQLLTNLAAIAEILGLEDRQKRLLSLRTWNTVLQTILAVYAAIPLPEIIWLAFILLIINLAILVMIVICLSGFRKDLYSIETFEHL